jgi:hypothetical protein
MNAELAYRGQMTERLIHALGLLGSDKLAVRLGAIYSLESIATNSPSDRKAVADILTAYLRSDARYPSPSTGPTPDLPSLRVSAPDRQAVVTVLSRGRATSFYSDETMELDAIDLQRASLRGAHLEGFDLRGADMRGADLREARLDRSQLDGVRLQGAWADKATVWPEGFDWRAAGVILRD